VTHHPRKNALNTPGRPFAEGNSGRPKGSRNKTTLAAEGVIGKHGEQVAKKMCELAIAGDVAAGRAILDRVAPVRRGCPIQFHLPPVTSANDVVTALDSILRVVADGVLSPEEGALVANLLETKRKAIEIVELESRVAELEKKAATA
jgi:hypothetical protein